MRELNKRQGEQLSESGDNVQVGSGIYVGGNVEANEGFNVVGSTTGNINFTNNPITGDDSKKLAELFLALQQQIERTPATTQEEQANKDQAKEAAQALESEIDKVKKDQYHRPNKFTMMGLIGAFKKLGAPVFNAAMQIVGFPALGAVVNQFAENLPDKE